MLRSAAGVNDLSAGFALYHLWDELGAAGSIQAREQMDVLGEVKEPNARMVWMSCGSG